MTNRQTIELADGAIAHIDEAAGSRGRCLVLPPFGLSAGDVVVLAAYLLHNGIDVIRYDGYGSPRRGPLMDYTLSAHRRAFDTIFDELPSALPVAMSLSSVPFFLGGRPEGDAVLVTPVVDLRETLHEVLDVDLLDCKPTEMPPSMNVLGHDVAQAFIIDCQQLGLGDSTSIVKGAANQSGPLHLVVSANDPLVSWANIIEFKKRVEDVGGVVELRPITTPGHHLDRHPLSAVELLQATTLACGAVFGIDDAEMEFPAFRSMLGVARSLRTKDTEAL